ncbi:MAG: NUDIX hydrolase [Gammaproteobacteria bacterium]|jgi:8-oxo-dGTP pyrophosphatase MutT (NUDIX family)
MFTGIIHYLERRQLIHRLLLHIWRLFPPRLAGFLKGLLSRSWTLGAVAVMVDGSVRPAQVLLVEHSYRRRGAWGLPGGALDSIPGSPTHPHEDESPDDVLEATLQREVQEELGIGVNIIRMLRMDAVPYVAEEPGPYRLTFYFLCTPAEGFRAFREGLGSGAIHPRSPEISRMELVPLDRLDDYDLFSPDGRLLRRHLSRLIPGLVIGTA